MTGHGGWPLNVVPHARAGAVLRRHLLPARAAPRAAELAPGAGGGRRGLAASSATRSQTPRSSDRAAAARRRAAEPVGRGSSTRAALDEAVDALRRRYDRTQRRLRRRAEVPAVLGDRVPAGARRARDGAADAARDGRRRDLRPGRRRLRALLGRRALDRAALREDALRQRAARPRVPARLAGHRRAAVRARLPRDARLGAARDARARGRLLLRARRRLRGRRGQVLRLDASTSCASCSATTPRPRSPTSA